MTGQKFAYLSSVDLYFQFRFTMISILLLVEGILLENWWSFCNAPVFL